MPRRLKIAYTERAFEIFGTVNGRDSIKAAQTDFTDTSALIITDLDSEFAENEKIRAFGVPVFLILTALDIRAELISENIRAVKSSMIFMEKTHSALIFAMQTSLWEIFLFMRDRHSPPKNMQRRSSMRIKRILC